MASTRRLAAILAADVAGYSRSRRSGSSTNHTIEPIPTGIANGRCGASSPIRRVVSHRLQIADSCPLVLEIVAHKARPQPPFEH